MAVPTYTSDLSSGIITNVETNTGTWSEFTAYSVGGTPVTNETDYFIQGANCTSATASKTGLASIAFDNATGVTIPTDGAVFVWQYFAAPNVLAAETAGGLRIIVGADISNANAWVVGGNDFAPNPYGGWNNVAVNPAGVTADYTHSNGNGGTYRWFGSGLSVGPGSVGKGNPHGIDAIRYGRGESRFANGSVGEGAATFAGFAATNDSISNRWGLMQAIAGGYKVKGLVVFGYVSAVYFVDSNANLFIDNTKKVTAGFNAFEVRQAGSTVSLTAVNITALGTVSRGNWITTDNATVTLTSCVFTDMGTFTFQSLTTVTLCTFRRCNLVTRGNATITNTTFDKTNNATKALLLRDPTRALTGCTFIKPTATSHAIEITEASATAYTFTNCNFTGYAATNGSTGNEVIYNNSGGAVTINHTGTTGGDITVKNEGVSTTTVLGSISITITVKDEANANINGAFVYIDENDNSPFIMNTTTSSGVATGSYSGASSSGTLRVRKYGYKPFKGTVDLTSAINQGIVLIADPQQV